MKIDSISLHSENQNGTQALLSLYVSFDINVKFKDIQAFVTKNAGKYLDEHSIHIRRWRLFRVDDIAEGKQLYIYKLFLKKDKKIMKYKFPVFGDEHCVICGCSLTGKFNWIGLDSKTGKYTYKEELASQGFFPIGLTCEKNIDKSKLLENSK